LASSPAKAPAASAPQTSSEFLPPRIEANRIVTDDAAIAPVVNDKAPYVLTSKVQGFVSPSEEWYDLNNVWLSS